MLSVVLLLAGCGSSVVPSTPPGSQGPAAPATGTRAPNFALTDQFGRTERLTDFQGHTVLLTFIDSHCTTVCPLTAELMSKVKQTLGHAVPVQLLAINANPDATAVSDVRRWSTEHRMMQRWLFLTGTAVKLRTVWNAYGIDVEVVHGDVGHTALLFLIDATGQVRAALPVAQSAGIDAEATTIADAVKNAL